MLEILNSDTDEITETRFYLTTKCEHSLFRILLELKTVIPIIIGKQTKN